jgi:chemotaxis protein CheX
MNVQNLMVDFILQATSNVFSTMLGADLGTGTASIERGMPDVNDGIVSFIGLAGEWAGTGSVTCSPAAACRICSLMLMMDTTAVNEDVLDAVAELTNMIVGGVKNDLEPHIGTLGLSIPTVVFGRNFRTKSAGSVDWTVVRFPWDDDFVTVKLFLAPMERVPHAVAHMMGQTCPIDL